MKKVFSLGKHIVIGILRQLKAQNSSYKDGE